MAVCSYLVFPAVGEREAVHAKLTEMPGCDVVPSTNRDVLLLITDTPGRQEDDRLRRSLEVMPGIEALLFTFGELPDTRGASVLADDREDAR